MESNVARKALRAKGDETFGHHSPGPPVMLDRHATYRAMLPCNDIAQIDHSGVVGAQWDWQRLDFASISGGYADGRGNSRIRCIKHGDLHVGPAIERPPNGFQARGAVLVTTSYRNIEA
jgi:hypothetical protein